MELRILELDGGLGCQRRLGLDGARTVEAQAWGPRIRLGCAWRRFRAFERFLGEALGPVDDRPHTTLFGSGDFHHVSLALLRRLPGPFNLLILDKHPDWMWGVPFLHCGTWVAHALKMSNVRHVFHLGGDLDFDNAFRWLAPWKHLRSGRVVAFPAVRRYTKGAWAGIEHEPLRAEPGRLVTWDRLEELLRPWRAELASTPLYVSVDKDVLRREEAVVNWDSGHLETTELETILEYFGAACHQVRGMDLLGDWSPVKVHGWLRRLLHFFEHDGTAVDADAASEINAATNRALIDCWLRAMAGKTAPLAEGVHAFRARVPAEVERLRPATETAEPAVPPLRRPR